MKTIFYQEINSLRYLIILVVSVCLLGAATATIADEISHECIVVPHTVLDLSSGVSGRVDTVHVDRADRIRAGQVLAELESHVERANLKLSETRASLDSEVNLREASLEFEQRRRLRIDNLSSLKVASEQEADDAEQNAVLAGWQLAVAKDNLYLARLEAERAAAVLELRNVISPFDGVVVERYKSSGEYVDEEPILRIARLDPLRVEVIVPIELHSDFEVGMSAEVFPETNPDQPWRATVTTVDIVGDPASGTFRARLELPNPDQSRLAGIKCTAQLIYEPVDKISPEITLSHHEKAAVTDTN
tara:strand:- start:2478 stop:3389 length:912 start_codon:yes stop_codon:yes gene_type:complete